MRCGREAAMAETDVLFTPDLVSVVVDLQRRSAACFDRECGVPYLPCCLLALLGASKDPMTISDFPRSMVASENTVVAAAIKLERAGLIEKAHCDSDRRIAVLRGIPEGNALAKRAFESAYRHLRATVWQWCSDDDAARIVGAFREAAEALGLTGRKERRAVHRCLTPSFFMAVAAIIRQWVQTCAAAGVAFTEYRYLALLQSCGQPLSCSAAADALMVDRSTVSVVAKSLIDKGLGVCGRGSDRRRRMISITESGKATAEFATSMLEDRTAALYAGADPSSTAAINALHARMYAELAAWVRSDREPGIKAIENAHAPA